MMMSAGCQDDTFQSHQHQCNADNRIFAVIYGPVNKLALHLKTDETNLFTTEETHVHLEWPEGLQTLPPSSLSLHLSPGLDSLSPAQASTHAGPRSV
ncbi:hypothetical protein Q8A67_022173 [Cirrhinus molitorella]|uniref:Uncharacterized protein n=1 Tax=Cirrhinus molitorella TaxID=172907 RepID=A0AA88P780_9TELE|nr:hypothetical protein Q8A67_022173 [Cirrhinus molitorella]